MYEAQRLSVVARQKRQARRDNIKMALQTLAALIAIWASVWIWWVALG